MQRPNCIVVALRMTLICCSTVYTLRLGHLYSHSRAARTGLWYSMPGGFGTAWDCVSCPGSLPQLCPLLQSHFPSSLPVLLANLMLDNFPRTLQVCSFKKEQTTLPTQKTPTKPKCSILTCAFPVWFPSIQSPRGSHCWNSVVVLQSWLTKSFEQLRRAPTVFLPWVSHVPLAKALSLSCSPWCVAKLSVILKSFILLDVSAL